MARAEAGLPAQRRTMLVKTAPTSSNSAPQVAVSERRWRRHIQTAVVGIAVLAITVALSLGARAVHNANENRLLHQRVKEAGAAISADLLSTLTPLRAAAQVAEATSGNRQQIQNVLGPLVGPNRHFASVVVFSYPDIKKLVGIHVNILQQTKTPATIQALMTRAARERNLTVVGLFNESPPRLGFAITAANPPIDYVIYAESVFPSNRYDLKQTSAAFTGLNYALYLGSEQPSHVYAANTTALPLRGRRASTAVTFGQPERAPAAGAGNQLSLVVTPTGQLGGRLLATLPWLLLAAGIIVAAAAAAMVERLVRQRERARRLAEENAGLYAAQRTVAQTLQHSLLPDTLPSIPGIEFRARYVAGVADIDIGGDWYDVVQLTNGNVLFVVGDVSGRGLPAATIMASLRYAIRAYAAHGDDPATILTKLSPLISVGTGGHFATVLCGVIDVAAHSVTVANAGHPQPLLIDGGQARFVATNIGVPIGVDDPTPYASVTLTVPPSATLLAYTDGLVERRGEHLDVGLERLRDTAGGSRVSVDELMANLADDVSPDGPADDVAILGVEWQS